MKEYRTSGTPWFVVIAPDGGLVLDGVQRHPEALIRILRPLAA